ISSSASSAACAATRRSSANTTFQERCWPGSVRSSRADTLPTERPVDLREILPGGAGKRTEFRAFWALRDNLPCPLEASGQRGASRINQASKNAGGISLARGHAQTSRRVVSEGNG